MNLLNSLGKGVGILSDVFNVGSDIWKTNKQLDLQREAWNREDTAVQRRVNDLKAAGLSPVLAAGSAASSSSPVNVGAPKASLGNTYTAVQMENARKQNALTDSQIDLTNAQLAKTEADSFISRMTEDRLQKDASGNGIKSYNLINSNINRMIAENNKAVRDAEETVRNSDLARVYGVPSNSSGAMDSIATGRMIDKMVQDGVKGGPLMSVILNAIKAIK